MELGPEYRDRDEHQVAVLEALVDRQHEGLTVFELRSHADIEIDTLEVTLRELKAENLITVQKNDNRTVILPDESVVPDENAPGVDSSLIDRIRDRLLL